MTKETKTIDGEQVEVIKTEQLSLSPVDSRGTTELLEIDIAKRKRNLAILLKIVQPSQLMSYGDGDKRQLYLTAGGADVALRAMGFRFGRKTVNVSHDENGVTAIAESDLLKPDGEYYEHFIGIRRMLYDKSAPGGIKGYIKDEPNLMRSALANLTHAAATQILGLRMLSPEDCRDVGVDLDKLQRHVDFQTTDETTLPDDCVARVAFGKNKGKPVTELDDRQLAWYIGAAETAIDDPAKEKYRSKNQKWYNSLLAEKARRGTPQNELDYGPPAWSDKERESGEEG